LKITIRNRIPKLTRGLVNSRPFLVLFGFFLVMVSIFLWKTQEERGLAQLALNTASYARSYASEAEIRYQKIYNALDRMSKREAARAVVNLDEWEKDAELNQNSFPGIKSIAWVDKSFLIQRIFPLQGNESALFEKASQLNADLSQVNLWLPINTGSELKGFILGMLDVGAFFSPVILDIKNDYMLQISNQGKIIFTSASWKQPQAGYVAERLITMQNAGVWTFSLAPTDGLINAEIVNSRNTLLISLLFTLITLIAVYFAQKFNVLSKLSELRFRKTLEGMREGCQIIGTDWRCLFANDTAALQFQRKKEELLGRPLIEYIPGIENTGLFHLLQRCMVERTPQELLYAFKFVDGAQGWYQLSIVPAPDGIFILSTDVSERKRAQEEIRQMNADLEKRVADRTAQLEASNKELEAFAYSVSHDLRAPLRAIDGYSRILQEEYTHKLDEEGQRLLGVVRTNTSTMDHLITDLLALSRVGRIEIKTASIDMTALVNVVYQEIATPRVLQKFTFNVARLPFASGDPILIRQVWVNLISNAIKYTLPKEACVIEINGSEKGGLCLYSIKDNGVGFNQKYADKLFGVFQRLHKAGDFEGTGVGLAIVQRIISRHGGRVWGEGQVGVGATFYFTLPGSIK
jgi:PAS domain S-box-containing protein